MSQQIQKQIVPVLKKHFAEDWKIIIALAYCRIVYQAPIKNVAFHLDCSSLLQMIDMESPAEKTVSQALRKIGTLRSNTVAYMKEFEQPDEYVLVDATDISCNSNNISLSQKGYNSDMNFEPQVTLLYIYSAKTHKPYFYRLVAGNIRDVTALKNALIESGITQAIFISKAFIPTTTLPS
ncbi:MAG TPA: hypothetical protein VKA92_05640 [Segetibacter sp.]|nr:hypothetical protein [Segetibacter sp.]